jgi:hypothetical protein
MQVFPTRPHAAQSHSTYRCVLKQHGQPGPPEQSLPTTIFVSHPDRRMEPGLVIFITIVFTIQQIWREFKQALAGGQAHLSSNSMGETFRTAGPAQVLLSSQDSSQPGKF